MSIHRLKFGPLALGSALLLGSGVASAAIPDARSGVRVAVALRLARDSAGRQGTRGVLTLTIPLERLVPHSVGLLAPTSPNPRPVLASPASGSARAGGAAVPGSSGRLPPSASRDRLALALNPELGRDTVAAALSAAGFGASARRLSSLSSRARSSAALPELRLRGGRSTDESLRLSPTTADPYRYTQAGATELFFEVRMTWKLDRLLFSEAELRVERLRRERLRAKARLVHRVLEVLFAWQRARTRLATATLLPEEQALLVLEQIEAEAVLDVYTGGWFTEHVAP